MLAAVIEDPGYDALQSSIPICLEIKPRENKRIVTNIIINVVNTTLIISNSPFRLGGLTKFGMTPGGGTPAGILYKGLVDAIFG